MNWLNYVREGLCDVCRRPSTHVIHAIHRGSGGTHREVCDECFKQLVQEMRDEKRPQDKSA